MKDELLAKANREMEEFKARLLNSSKEEILENAYRYSTMEAIIFALESSSISEAKAAVLLKLPAPVSAIYDRYLKMDDERTETIGAAINEAVSRVFTSHSFFNKKNNPRDKPEPLKTKSSNPKHSR